MFEPINSTLRINLVGDNTATILCLSEYYFKFLLVQEVSISNIQFKNCGGITTGNGHNFHPTLQFDTGHYFSVIILDRIQIVTQRKSGIMIKFNHMAKNHSFSLTDSHIHTDSVGLFTAESKYYINYMITIKNVLFHSSCIVLGTSAFHMLRHNVAIDNTSFIRCLCSPVLSIHGNTTVKLNNINISDTKSPVLIHSMVRNSIYLQGLCFFSLNRGAVLITSLSKLIFSSAKVIFSKNTVPAARTEDPGAVLAIDNSVIIFDKSHVISLCITME